MHSLNKTSNLYGFVFVAIFLAQQIIAFVWEPFRLVSPYWILVTIISLILGLKLPIHKYLTGEAFNFTVVCSICSIFTIINGTSPGEVLVKIIYMTIAFFGYVLLNEKHLNLRWFDLAIVVLYIYFYKVYYSLDIGTRIMNDGDLFGHSSSNTIAMILNIVLWVYYLLSSVYQKKNFIKLFIFSVVNLVLIVIQGSRAGIVVALLLLLLIVIGNFEVKKKWLKYILYGVVFGGAALLILRFLPLLEDIVEISNMQGIESYEEDVRSVAQGSFFLELDLVHALIGYDSNHEFAGGITRTFNAFLDFWKTFGLLPMLFLFVAIVKRIKNRNNYMLPLLSLAPILVYSLVESLWGGTFWDIIIYICLFWPRKCDLFESMKKCNQDIPPIQVGKQY